jgi:hypothetical protein
MLERRSFNIELRLPKPRSIALAAMLAGFAIFLLGVFGDGRIDGADLVSSGTLLTLVGVLWSGAPRCAAEENVRRPVGKPAMPLAS